MIKAMLFALPFSLLLSGCVNSVVEEVRSGATGMRSTDQVVVLGRRHNNGYETEPDFVSCVGNNLGNGRDGITVLPERQFVDSLFPFFEPRTAPLEIRDLPDLMANEMVAERLQQQGVRYLVWLDGSTSTNDQSGSMTCAVSPTGGGCFGFVTWDRESTYEASIWDLETMTSVGKISTDASGTSYMPAVILPVPLIARVQSSACGGMSNQLKTFLQTTG